jgi:integrase
VRRWLEFWLSDTVSRLRSSTAGSYRGIVHRHLIPWLGGHRLSKLRVREVQRAMDAIGRTQVRGGRLIAPGTLRGIRAVLHSALAEAGRQGMIGHNPAWRLRLPDGRRPYAVLWDKEREQAWRETGFRPAVAVWDLPHVARFLEAVRGDPLFALWWLVALHGPRRGEIVGLRWEDLDLAGEQLSIKEQVLVVDGVEYLGPPKSVAGCRTLSLDFMTVLIFRELWSRQKHVLGRRPSGRVFRHANGRPVQGDWLTRRFAKLVKQLDLPPVRLHDLRHGAASIAAAAGVDLKVIQHNIGHMSAVTTADTYIIVLRQLAAFRPSYVNGASTTGLSASRAACLSRNGLPCVRPGASEHRRSRRVPARSGQSRLARFVTRPT